ncbi:MAG: non-homologous end-joining DNA ligase [Acidobacteria bacterium]|nr:non-homologous end-joining DNA ligase [Acidobacteriota bacterium]
MDIAYHPQLAALVSRPPDGDDWLHEIKFDGYRIGCRIQQGRAALISRGGQDWTDRFPDIAEDALGLDARDALLDGEVAVVLPDGRTSFEHLQRVASGGPVSSGLQRQGTNRAALVYFVFDLLRLDGRSLTHLPLDARKAALRSLIPDRPIGRIRYADHVVGQGVAFFTLARQRGLEGVISKRRDERHHAGRRGGWVKSKCTQRQEFVIGGFTDPAGTRQGIGALVIGHYDHARLVCAGRVGTGFTDDVARDLRRRLDAMTQPACPFDPPPSGAWSRRAHWVAPSLVCEVAFTEWTSDGNVRHPSFQGVRGDKEPREVTREHAAPDSARR